ncbi:YciI family protein [Mucilaginibacter sabulilitoris]|uniref:YciI family protein n=1 Tax=Mucilaginibacter sabulilitoris TaxID=1173583 RepID=A0ABZ0TFD8_9SPHI|nr:YciI family protein [Mucilaginibacter sabulilitoris]WPU90923.1 YciI family protein [Mucilaginibacter sabulilitoris]
MKEFLFIFRRDFKAKEIQPAEYELEKNVKHWKDWLDLLTEKGLLAQKHKSWDAEGSVMKPGESVTNGPYAEIKHSIGGMVVIKAENYDQAGEIAKGCPIFELGGSVEIRMGL